MDLIEESFDFELIAGLIAQTNTNGCDRQLSNLYNSDIPANLQSHKAFVTGVEILSAFGLSF